MQTDPLPGNPPAPSVGGRYGLARRAIVVAALTLALLIPLGMINGTIKERINYRQQAVTGNSCNRFTPIKVILKLGPFFLFV